MQTKSFLIASVAALGLAACGGQSASSDTETPAAPAVDLNAALTDVATGAYSLERNHAFLTFQVSHANGVSSYQVALTDFDVDVSLDTANPEASSVTASINPMGVQANYPSDYKAGHPDSVYESWNEDISRDAKWLNADAFPEITFASTSVERTGADTGTVTGDLTFLGQTKPVTLDVTFNGHTNVPWFGERDVIGFNATTTLTRSEWGMDSFLPFVGDEVAIAFSGEFLQDE